MDKPLVDIIIPVYRAQAMLAKTMDSVQPYTAWPNKLYIADDCSNLVELHSYYLSLKDVTVLKATRRRGFGDICNWAVNQCTNSPFICLLNSDVVVTKGWLSNMMRCMLSDDNIGIVGAKLLYPRDKKGVRAGKIQHVGVARHDGGIPFHPFQNSRPAVASWIKNLEVNAVTGACFLVRRSCWSQLRGFDRNFTMGNYEDVDFCWRAREKGWKIFVDGTVTIYHYEHGSGEEYTAEGQKNRPLLLARWGGLKGDEFLFERRANAIRNNPSIQ